MFTVHDHCNVARLVGWLHHPRYSHGSRWNVELISSSSLLLPMQGSVGPPTQGAMTPSMQQPSSNYSQHSGSLPIGSHGQQPEDTHSNAGSDTPLTSMVAQMHSGDNNSETGKCLPQDKCVKIYR